MLNLNTTIIDLISQRYSCRSYRREALALQKREQLHTFLETLPPGPFGSRPRFELLAATEEDRKSLRGLGTYGFIKNSPAFILGAMLPSRWGLEDYGYLMESIILFATSLGLGTCWLGGTFTKSGFANSIQLSSSEEMPAVVSVGAELDQEQKRQGWVSRRARAHKRLSWDKIFFSNGFNKPLIRKNAGAYADVLEMVRIGPSASNKQPWRIVKYEQFWRLYLQRTHGYYQDPVKRILGLCDLQRLDMGIAMCHFELTAKEQGLKGKWVIEEGVENVPDELTEYIVSWGN